MPKKTKKPAPPKELSDEARAEWDRVVGELSRRGTITKSDRSLLMLYVQQWERNQDAAAKLRDSGHTRTYAHNGATGLSQDFKVLQDTTKLLRKLLADLRLTPASRPTEEVEEELDLS